MYVLADKKYIKKSTVNAVLVVLFLFLSLFHDEISLCIEFHVVIYSHKMRTIILKRCGSHTENIVMNVRFVDISICRKIYYLTNSDFIYHLPRFTVYQNYYNTQLLYLHFCTNRKSRLIIMLCTVKCQGQNNDVNCSQ